MKKSKLHIFLFLITLLLLSGKSFGAIYYIDAIAGRDNHNGLSPQNAWQTLEKASKGFYQAGDKILLKGGRTFTGSLTLKSTSGQAGSPIVWKRMEDISCYLPITTPRINNNPKLVENPGY